LRYGHTNYSLEAFPGSSGEIHLGSRQFPLTITPRSTYLGICLQILPTGLDGLLRWIDPPASPHHSNAVVWYGNLYPLSIAYALRPRLRPDSPAADQHGCGTLGHSVGRIRTALALLIPAFALHDAPAGQIGRAACRGRRG